MAAAECATRLRTPVAHVEAVVSAGGSMNREAAVLGTPAYSVYGGKLAAVDRNLVMTGRLQLLLSESDVDGLGIGAKPPGRPPVVGRELLVELVDRLLELARV